MPHVRFPGGPLHFLLRRRTRRTIDLCGRKMYRGYLRNLPSGVIPVRRWRGNQLVAAQESGYPAGCAQGSHAVPHRRVIPVRRRRTRLGGKAGIQPRTVIRGHHWTLAFGRVEKVRRGRFKSDFGFRSLVSVAHSLLWESRIESPHSHSVLKKSNGAKLGVQGVAIGGPQLAVGVLEMNCGVPPIRLTPHKRGLILPQEVTDEGQETAVHG